MSTTSASPGAAGGSAPSYEDLERDYEANLGRIRSFLAGSTRSRSTLQESERLLTQAKQYATQMQRMAETQLHDPMRATSARQKLERDIQPLAREIQRSLQEFGRDEIFGNAAANANMGYQPPDIENNDSGMMDSLLSSSEDLLRESHMILNETEEIGTSTLMQLGRQREQLQNANEHVRAVQDVAIKAKSILTSMSRKALRSKICLYILITLLGSANLYVLYLIIMKHFGTTTNPNNLHHRDGSN